MDQGTHTRTIVPVITFFFQMIKCIVLYREPTDHPPLTLATALRPVKRLGLQIHAVHRLGVKVPEKCIRWPRCVLRHYGNTSTLAAKPSLPMQDSSGFMICDRRAAMAGPGEQVPSARLAASSIPRSGRRVATQTRLASTDLVIGNSSRCRRDVHGWCRRNSGIGQAPIHMRHQIPSHELRSHD